MKERLQEYALIAEIIGGIAVIVSLLFVGLEIRQSNMVAATESLREGAIVWQNAYLQSIGTEESTAFWRKSLNNYDGLNKDEKGRFYATFFGYVAAFDALHNQYEAGLLREETYVSIARAYYTLVKMPGVQQMFDEQEVYLAPYLVDPEHNPAPLGREEDFPPWRFLEDS